MNTLWMIESKKNIFFHQTYANYVPFRINEKKDIEWQKHKWININKQLFAVSKIIDYKTEFYYCEKKP